jgi:hypothetical protein
MALRIIQDVSISISLSGIAKKILVSISLAHDVYQSIRSWWEDEISGKICCKQIMDSIFSTAGAVAGGLIGSTLGSFMGPLGLIFGGVIGGFLGCESAKIVSDWFTTILLENSALENANLLEQLLEEMVEFLCRLINFKKYI